MQEGEGEKWRPGRRFQILLSYGSRWRTDPAVSPLLHTLKMEGLKMAWSEDGRMQKSFKTRAQTTLSSSVHPVQCHKMWTARRTLGGFYRHLRFTDKAINSLWRK